MYQALYRKWRPRTFDEVVGQQHITTTLKRQVETGRLSHAYLFIGTRGTGKTTCAKILARAVNCEHPVNGNPCNQCAACRGIESGSILDVVELDAASNNRVDDVRALQDEAIFSPASVKKRVYIIDEVHMLSTAAFNALLKILEEPPEHLMFILCTTELHKVLPTIVSRCQRHSFKRIDAETIAGRLAYVAEQEGLNLAPEAGALLARLADGGMRDALSLLDQCAAAEHIDVDAVLSAMGLAGGQRTVELLDAVCDGAADKALTLFDGLWRDGKDPAGILDELGGLMRDVLLLQVAPKGGEALLSGTFERKTLEHFSQRLSGSRLMDGLDAIRAADLSGANPRRAAEMCLISLCVPETGQSLQGLRNRVSRLEAALQSGVRLAAPVAAEGLPVDVSAPEPPALEETPASGPTAAGKEPVGKESALPRDETPPHEDGDAPPWDEVPPHEDADEPPWMDERPREESARKESAPSAPPAEKPGGGAAPAADRVWEALVRRLNGKLDMGTYAMISTASQATGSLSGDVLTVYPASPLARMLLDKPEVIRLFQQELREVTGGPVRVVFADKSAAAAPQPDIDKLNELKRFSNFKIE